MRLLIALILGAAFFEGGASAAPQSVEDIAQYQSVDRQAVLEAGAMREGHLMVYCTGTQADPVFRAFQHKYPFVQVEAVRGDGPTTSRRIIEEYGAQTHLVDVIELTTQSLHLLRDTGVLQSYRSPQFAALDPDAIEQNRHWALDYQSYLSLGYNTQLVTDAEAPKTLDDLNEPKWKGLIALPGSTTLPNWIGAVLREKDESFLRKLAQQHVRIFQVSARAVANLIVSGAVALSPAIYAAHIANSQATGASVAWRALGGIYSDTDAVALGRFAPHPNAAMLYLDFILSHDGQSLFQKLGYASARKDMEPTERPARIYYLGDEPDYLQNYEKWTALAHEIFGQ